MNSQKAHTSPTILVIFGMTGDLAVKKIIPSLWHLFKSNHVFDSFTVIGFSRRSFSGNEFKEYLSEALRKSSPEVIDDNQLQKFSTLFSYQSGKFEDENAFQILSNTIKKTETEWGVCTNKLFYLAVPPANYETIFENLAKVKLNLPCGGELGWSRILIEKPFGTDLFSARQLQSLLSNYFKEEQIYGIDHYLFKEIVQGIENFRFSNNLFEQVWDNATIDKVDISLLETIGAENRGSFYDSVGALRDVGQNHLLSILATITMDYPTSKDETDIRNSRAKLLSTLRPWTEETLRAGTYRAQYHEYLKIEGVEPDSHTETYFSVQTELLHPKWKGVPITISAGKKVSETCKEIVVTLKHPTVCHLCQVDPNHKPNQIIFRLAPNDEVIISFWIKRPGFEQKLEERSLSFFLYEKETKTQYVEEYAKILHAAMKGGQSQFVSFPEIKAGWEFTDPIIEFWQNNMVPLNKYQQGTTPEPKLKDSDSAFGNMVIPKELGMIGLGKMGANLARQLMSKGWKVHGYNRSPEVTHKMATEGLLGVLTLNELIEEMPSPRTLWLMVPHQFVGDVVDKLLPHLSEGDTIIDGGNSPYHQSMELAQRLKNKGLHFLDVGVSGGPSGARYGACVMVGGERQVYEKYEPLFRDITVKDGHGYMGSSGAGHFVKMIHNGIEYGMMQSLAEGFEVLKNAPFSLDLRSIAKVYNHGSVITSRLVDWLHEAYIKFGDKLDTDECCSGQVSQSGEGLWTVETAKELHVPVPIIEGSVNFRKQSQNNPSYTGRVLSALRHQFGGHETSQAKKEK